MLQLPSDTELPLAGILNPFTDAVVGTAWDTTDVDVSEIHGDVFRAIEQAIDQRSGGYPGRVLLVHGDAGSGKTHILRRLRVRLEGWTASNSPVKAFFSFIRLNSSPGMIWRFLRHSIVRDLTRQKVRGRTQLDWMITIRRDRISDIDGNLGVVLEHIAEGRNVREAYAWLAGTPLSPESRDRLGVGEDDLEDEANEASSRAVILGLARWIAPSPLVLCLDQLDSVQAFPGDQAAFFKIGKILCDLRDELKFSIVVVGCIQTGFLDAFQSAMGKADLDRIQPRALLPLKMEQVRALVAARLQSQPEIAARRPKGASMLWPIDATRFEPLVNSPTGVTPRKVMFECAKIFERHQAGIGESSETLERSMERLYEERWKSSLSRNSAQTTRLVLSDGLAKMLALRGCEVRRDNLPPWADHQFLAPHSSVPVAVALIDGSSRALWRRLERIHEHWQPSERQLVLMRDGRDGIPDGAKGSQDRLAELLKRGARLLQPSPEALAALDAARILIAESESGDLAHGGDPIHLRDVEDWLRRNTPEPVVRLLDELAPAAEDSASPPESSPPIPVAEHLAAFLNREKLALVVSAAQAVQSTTEEVMECARQNPNRFGLLGGAQPVVFQRLAEFQRV